MRSAFRSRHLVLLSGLLAMGCRPVTTPSTGSSVAAPSGQAGANIPVGVAVGMRGPQIEGEDIDGKPMRLDDYRGKVVLLDFWGNW